MKEYGLAAGMLVIGLIGGYFFGMNNTQLKMPHIETEEHMDDGHMHMADVSSDREFIEHMIPHHQEAVDTAREVLERGGEISEVKTLAENIITAQEKEIVDMKSWYKEWYGTDFKDVGVYEPMMRELETFSGKELDIIFTKDMIIHHMGALMMANSALSFAEHKELQMLSQNILTTQQEEIELMKHILQRYEE